MGSGGWAARARVRGAVCIIGVVCVVGSVATAAPGGVERPGSPERGSAPATVAQAGYSDPAWSRDGRIAFVRRLSGAAAFALWVMNADGTGAHPLVTGSQLAVPDWSPDGSRIVYGDQGGVYVVNGDGSGKHVLVSDVNAGEPAWSPDGTRIAYGQTTAQGDAQIHVINPDGSSDRDTGLLGSSPTWSPDSSKLAFLPQNRGGSTNEIDVAPADGSGAPGQFVTGSTIGDPAWSPDGSAIAFTAITTGYVKAIWTAAYPVTEAPRVLASTEVSLVSGSGTPGNVDHPRWSPDGRRIVFLRNPNLTRDQAVCLKRNPSCPVHTSDIYVVNRDGSGLKNVTYGITTKPKPTHCLPEGGDFASVGAHALAQLCFQKATGTLHGRKLRISGQLGPSGAKIPTAVRANLDTMSGYPLVWRIRVRGNGTFAGTRSLTKGQVRILRTFQNRIRLAAGTFGSRSNRTSTTIKVKRT